MTEASFQFDVAPPPQYVPSINPIRSSLANVGFCLLSILNCARQTATIYSWYGGSRYVLLNAKALFLSF